MFGVTKKELRESANEAIQAAITPARWAARSSEFKWLVVKSVYRGYGLSSEIIPLWVDDIELADLVDEDEVMSRLTMFPAGSVIKVRIYRTTASERAK